MPIEYIVTEDTLVIHADGHGDAVLAVEGVLANYWLSFASDISTGEAASGRLFARNITPCLKLRSRYSRRADCVSMAAEKRSITPSPPQGTYTRRPRRSLCSRSLAAPSILGQAIGYPERAFTPARQSPTYDRRGRCW